MILIERFNRFGPGNERTCMCQRGEPGQWQRAWQGEDWDDEARLLVQMCDHNGDPWRATFSSERVRQ